MSSHSVWRERLSSIDTAFDALQLPRIEDDDQRLTQDEEWCTVTVDGVRRRIRFHDYASIYRIPGLYEHLFYDRLECCSPYRVTRLLAEVVKERGQSVEALRVLDLGAGNGMVGDELCALGVELLYGVDIIPEAKDAALRDREGLYEGYLVADMTDLPETQDERLARQRLNCLTSVATLGFNDIPPKAFLKAMSLISTPGWVAFNIKEDFLYEDDDSGFAGLVHRLRREKVLRIEAYRRYRHRLAVDGQPLFYIAMVASKRKPIPNDWL